MSPARWLVTALMLAALAGLIGWQQHRQRLVATCQSSGGIWDGPLGVCGPPLPSPILKRDLERS